MAACSRKTLKKIHFCVFWTKRPFTGKFSKFRPERIHRDNDRRDVFKFRENWLTKISKIVHTAAEKGR